MTDKKNYCVDGECTAQAHNYNQCKHWVMAMTSLAFCKHEQWNDTRNDNTYLCKSDAANAEGGSDEN